MDEKPLPSVGDEVEVRFTYGKPVKGAVTKIGYKNIYVRFGSRTEMFRRTTHVIADDYGQVWIVTPEEAERERREKAAWAVLHGTHLRQEGGGEIPLALLEALAATVTQYQATKGGG